MESRLTTAAVEVLTRVWEHRCERLTEEQRTESEPAANCLLPAQTGGTDTSPSQWHFPRRVYAAVLSSLLQRLCADGDRRRIRGLVRRWRLSTLRKPAGKGTWAIASVLEAAVSRALKQAMCRVTFNARERRSNARFAAGVALWREVNRVQRGHLRTGLQLITQQPLEKTANQLHSSLDRPRKRWMLWAFAHLQTTVKSTQQRWNLGTDHLKTALNRVIWTRVKDPIALVLAKLRSLKLAKLLVSRKSQLKESILSSLSEMSDTSVKQIKNERVPTIVKRAFESAGDSSDGLMRTMNSRRIAMQLVYQYAETCITKVLGRARKRNLLNFYGLVREHKSMVKVKEIVAMKLFETAGSEEVAVRRRYFSRWDQSTRLYKLCKKWTSFNFSVFNRITEKLILHRAFKQWEDGLGERAEEPYEIKTKFAVYSLTEAITHVMKRNFHMMKFQAVKSQKIRMNPLKLMPKTAAKPMRFSFSSVKSRNSKFEKYQFLSHTIGQSLIFKQHMRLLTSFLKLRYMPSKAIQNSVRNSRFTSILQLTKIILEKKWFSLLKTRLYKVGRKWYHQRVVGKEKEKVMKRWMNIPNGLEILRKMVKRLTKRRFLRWSEVAKMGKLREVRRQRLLTERQNNLETLSLIPEKRENSTKSEIITAKKTLKQQGITPKSESYLRNADFLMETLAKVLLQRNFISIFMVRCSKRQAKVLRIGRFLRIIERNINLQQRVTWKRLLSQSEEQKTEIRSTAIIPLLRIIASVIEENHMKMKKSAISHLKIYESDLIPATKAMGWTLFSLWKVRESWAFHRFTDIHTTSIPNSPIPSEENLEKPEKPLPKSVPLPVFPPRKPLFRRHKRRHKSSDFPSLSLHSLPTIQDAPESDRCSTEENRRNLTAVEEINRGKAMKKLLARKRAGSVELRAKFSLWRWRNGPNAPNQPLILSEKSPFLIKFMHLGDILLQRCLKHSHFPLLLSFRWWAHKSKRISHNTALAKALLNKHLSYLRSRLRISFLRWRVEAFENAGKEREKSHRLSVVSIDVPMEPVSIQGMKRENSTEVVPAQQGLANVLKKVIEEKFVWKLQEPLRDVFETLKSKQVRKKVITSALYVERESPTIISVFETYTERPKRFSRMTNTTPTPQRLPSPNSGSRSLSQSPSFAEVPSMPAKATATPQSPRSPTSPVLSLRTVTLRKVTISKHLKELKLNLARAVAIWRAEIQQSHEAKIAAERTKKKALARILSLQYFRTVLPRVGYYWTKWRYSQPLVQPAPDLIAVVNQAERGKALGKVLIHRLVKDHQFPLYTAFKLWANSAKSVPVQSDKVPTAVDSSQTRERLGALSKALLRQHITFIQARMYRCLLRWKSLCKDTVRDSEGPESTTRERRRGAGGKLKGLTVAIVAKTVRDNREWERTALRRWRGNAVNSQLADDDSCEEKTRKAATVKRKVKATLLAKALVRKMLTDMKNQLAEGFLQWRVAIDPSNPVIIEGKKIGGLNRRMVKSAKVQSPRSRLKSAPTAPGAKLREEQLAKVLETKQAKDTQFRLHLRFRKWKYSLPESLPSIAASPQGVVPKAPGAIAEPAEAIVESPETVVKPPEVIAKPSEVIEEPPEVIAKPPEVIAKPPEVIEEPPEVIAKPPEVIAEPPETIAEPPEAIVKPPEAIVKPPEAIVKPPEAIAEPPEAIAEPSEAIVEPATTDVARDCLDRSPEKSKLKALTSIVVQKQQRDRYSLLLTALKSIKRHAEPEVEFQFPPPRRLQMGEFSAEGNPVQTFDVDFGSDSVPASITYYREKLKVLGKVIVGKQLNDMRGRLAEYFFAWGMKAAKGTKSKGVISPKQTKLKSRSPKTPSHFPQPVLDSPASPPQSPSDKSHVISVLKKWENKFSEEAKDLPRQKSDSGSQSPSQSSAKKEGLFPGPDTDLKGAIDSAPSRPSAEDIRKYMDREKPALSAKLKPLGKVLYTKVIKELSLQKRVSLQKWKLAFFPQSTELGNIDLPVIPRKSAPERAAGDDLIQEFDKDFDDLPAVSDKGCERLTALAKTMVAKEVNDIQSRMRQRLLRWRLGGEEVGDARRHFLAPQSPFPSQSSDPIPTSPALYKEPITTPSPTPFSPKSPAKGELLLPTSESQEDIDMKKLKSIGGITARKQVRDKRNKLRSSVFKMKNEPLDVIEEREEFARSGDSDPIFTELNPAYAATEGRKFSSLARIAIGKMQKDLKNNLRLRVLKWKYTGRPGRLRIPDLPLSRLPLSPRLPLKVVKYEDLVKPSIPVQSAKATEQKVKSFAAALVAQQLRDSRTMLKLAFALWKKRTAQVLFPLVPRLLEHKSAVSVPQRKSLPSKSLSPKHSPRNNKEKALMKTLTSNYKNQLGLGLVFFWRKWKRLSSPPFSRYVQMSRPHSGVAIETLKGVELRPQGLDTDTLEPGTGSGKAQGVRRLLGKSRTEKSLPVKAVPGALRFESIPGVEVVPETKPEVHIDSIRKWPEIALQEDTFKTAKLIGAKKIAALLDQKSPHVDPGIGRIDTEGEDFPAVEFHSELKAGFDAIKRYAPKRTTQSKPSKAQCSERVPHKVKSAPLRSPAAALPSPRGLSLKIPEAPFSDDEYTPNDSAPREKMDRVRRTLAFLKWKLGVAGRFEGSGKVAGLGKRQQKTAQRQQSAIAPVAPSSDHLRPPSPPYPTKYHAFKAILTKARYYPLHRFFVIWKFAPRGTTPLPRTKIVLREVRNVKHEPHYISYRRGEVTFPLQSSSPRLETYSKGLMRLQQLWEGKDAWKLLRAMR